MGKKLDKKEKTGIFIIQIQLFQLYSSREVARRMIMKTKPRKRTHSMNMMTELHTARQLVLSEDIFSGHILFSLIFVLFILTKCQEKHQSAAE